MQYPGIPAIISINLHTSSRLMVPMKPKGITYDVIITHIQFVVAESVKWRILHDWAATLAYAWHSVNQRLTGEVAGPCELDVKWYRVGLAACVWRIIILLPSRSLRPKRSFFQRWASAKYGPFYSPQLTGWLSSLKFTWIRRRADC
jgi:hypothetical protein